jgi:membrane protease YdiL (CAAX protease family)
VHVQPGARKPDALQPLGIASTAAVFGAFSLLTALVVGLGVPWLHAMLGVPNLVAWYITGTLGLLLPMLVFAVLMARREVVPPDRHGVTVRLRLTRLSRADAAWALGGLLVIVLLTAAIMVVARAADPLFVAGPSFLRGPLGWPVLWILLAWIPLYVSNILGEELCWRGYLLPRQEVAAGRGAWLLNGVCWCLFHWSFGWQIMLLTLPISLILPAIVQRRQSTWVGIIIHGLFNAAGFVAVITTGIV